MKTFILNNRVISSRSNSLFFLYLLISTLFICGCDRNITKQEDARTVNPQQPQTMSPMPTQKSPRQQLSVRQSVNFKRLEDLLAAGKWQDADVETRQVMLQAAGIEMPQGTLDRESIDNFPCDALSTIDRLWLRYSNNRFGISVQKKIWLEVGGKLNYDYDGLGGREEGIEATRLLGARVGWSDYSPGGAYSSREIVYNLDSPIGHLPYLYFHQSIRRGWGPGRFFSRVESCNL